MPPPVVGDDSTRKRTRDRTSTGGWPPTRAASKHGFRPSPERLRLDPQLIDDPAAHGVLALVIDTTNSAASLLLEAVAHRGVPVAYVTGPAMRRAADLYAGRPRPTPKTPRCSPTTPAETPIACPGRPPATNCWRGCGFSTAETPTSQRMPTEPPTGFETPCWRCAGTAASHRRQAGRQRRPQRRAGALGFPNCAQIGWPGTGVGPHRQTLSPLSTAAHRGDLGRARRAESHRHRRGRLERHHLRAPACNRRRPAPATPRQRTRPLGPQQSSPADVGVVVPPARGGN